MKKFMNLALAVFAVTMLSLSVSSCNKDTCYECTGFDDGMGTVLEDAGVICVGETDDTGAVYTEETLEAGVALYEAFGGTCEKQ